MKITTILVVISFACLSQQVIRVSDPKHRAIIEQFTLENCQPHAIKFVQDGNGDWITNIENLNNERFTFKESKRGATEAVLQLKLSAELSKEGLNAQHIADMLTKYGEPIDYVPVKEVVEVSEKEENPTKENP
jgi:hypothetical protein